MTMSTDELILACMDLDVLAMRAALEAGAAPNQSDGECRRPVFHVLFEGEDTRPERCPQQREQDRASALGLLLEHGVRLDLKDPKGTSAYEKITGRFPLCAQSYLRHVGTSRGVAKVHSHLLARPGVVGASVAWWEAQAASVEAEKMEQSLVSPVVSRGLPRF